MATTFAESKREMLSAFADSWATVKPSWVAATQTAFPPITYERSADQWIKVMVTHQAGQNRAVGILDEVQALFTVDVYNSFDAAALATSFGVDDLAGEVHQAMRSMILPSGIDDVEIQVRDYPLTDKNYEHKRLSMFFRFDLARYA